MKPFAIAGIQMYLGHGSNVDTMRQRIDLTMHLYPWVQMVMFSELAVFGPMLHHAQPLPGGSEEEFQTIAQHHKIWLVNGAMYERRESAQRIGSLRPDDVQQNKIFRREKLDHGFRRSRCA